MRLARIDRNVALIAIVDKATEPAPGYAPAVKTDEGYLLVDAFIARDGVLRYSDGRDSWDEYRPREELARAAATWHHTPVTDEHPDRMVDASTWAQVARGVHVSTPVLDGPYPNGVTYLRAKLLITDADLVEKIERGQRELSIGFTSEIVPTQGGVAHDGTRADAVQTAMVGNHTASVPKGRAGPTVRVLMDGAAWSVLDDGGAGMAQRNVKPKLDFSSEKKPKADELGTPIATAEVIGPDGSPIALPTWVVAKLEELMALKQASMAQGSQPPGPMAPEAQQPPAAPAAPAMEAAAAPAEGGPPMPDENEDEKTRDAIAQVERRFRRREKLVMDAAALGVEAGEVRKTEDNDELARKCVAKAFGEDFDAKSYKGDALDALVDVAVRQHAANEARAAKGDAPPRVWEQPKRVGKGDEDKSDAADPDRAAEIAYLKTQGYAH